MILSSQRANRHMLITRGANLTGADLSDINLTGANLTDANLTGANLSDANLTCATLKCANLTYANLTGANLTGANLTGANLTYASLSDANLTCATLKCATLKCANLTGANLTGANLAWTCLDPANALPVLSDAEIQGSGLEIDGIYVCGWRTASSIVITGKCEYIPGYWYMANAFSADQGTDCHPGIYLGGKRYIARTYPCQTLVRCRCLRSELLHTFGDKWRAKGIEVY